MAGFFVQAGTALLTFCYTLLMNIEPIATILTPFSEKFAIPRQAQIVNQAIGILQFTPAYQHPEYLNGLSAHSHYWLIWGFHQHEGKTKSQTVRPPRLGGNTAVGVFATRSPFRPNNLGLSLVKLQHIDKKRLKLNFSGVDMLSGSPVYDIKPYIPYADCCTSATSTWANDAPTPDFSVHFLPKVLCTLQAYDAAQGTQLLALLQALLAYDARPAYKKAQATDTKRYATRLYTVDVAWQINAKTVTVIDAVVG